MEQIIKTWPEIAKFFGVHTSTIMRRRRELQDAGVIFYMLEGKRKRRIACAFPSLLKAWITKKASSGERF